MAQACPPHKHCTVPYFGFKAKQENEETESPVNCTVPYFGFKAKLNELRDLSNVYCTVPYFGFKAKQSCHA